MGNLKAGQWVLIKDYSKLRQVENILADGYFEYWAGGNLVQSHEAYIVFKIECDIFHLKGLTNEL